MKAKKRKLAFKRTICKAKIFSIFHNDHGVTWRQTISWQQSNRMGTGQKTGATRGYRGVAIRRKSNRIIHSSGSFLSIALASFLRSRYLITQRLLGLCTKREHYGKKRRSCAEQRRLLPRSTRVSTCSN